MTVIIVGGKAYELVQEHKDAWKPDAFKERYSEVLERYDYIVGDWGYNQLRLKGFFKDGNNRANKDSSFAAVQDYLQEYCNFGCAYFILERLSSPSSSEAGGTSPAGADSDDELGHEQFGDRSEVDRALGGAEPGLHSPVPEGMQRIVGVAGSMAFSDRKPYSWREHQSVRSNRNADRGDKGEAGAKHEGGGAPPRRDGRDGRGAGGHEPRPGGGGRQGGARTYEGKPRHERSFGAGGGGPHRGPTDRGTPVGGGAGNGAGGGRPQENGGAGGGRKFPKGPRPNGGPGGGGPNGSSPGGAGPRGGRNGGRPQESGAPREHRPEGGGSRHAHASPGGGRDRAQQRHFRKPQPPTQP